MSKSHTGVDTVLRLLRRGSVEQRAHAAYVLGNWRVKRARLALERLLSDGTDPNLRDYAVEALGYLGSRASVPALMSRSTDPSPEVAYACCIALSNIGDPRALPALRELSKRRERAYGKFSIGNAARESIRGLNKKRQ